MFIFKTDVYKVVKEGKQFPVGTPKIIKELKAGDEIYFEMVPFGKSNKADDITMYHENGEQHTLKKGKLFSALQDIHLALK